MAKKIKAPAREPIARQVNWSEFADGHWWELEEGRDFDKEPRKAARAARQWGSNNGFRCQCSFPDDRPRILQIRISRVEI